MHFTGDYLKILNFDTINLSYPRVFELEALKLGSYLVHIIQNNLFFSVF